MPPAPCGQARLVTLSSKRRPPSLPSCAPPRTGSTREAAAFTAYGRGVQEVQDVQRILELRRTELRGDLASYRRQRADAQNDGLMTLGIGADAEAAKSREATLTRRIGGLDQQLAGIDREWQALVERRAAVNAAAVAALSGAPVLGPLALLQSGAAAGVGQILLHLSAVDLLTLTKTDPALANRLRSADPASVSTWWAGLSDEERGSLVTGLPAIIGNLEGVPYAARDKANRIWLNQQLAEARENMKAAEQPPGVWMMMTGGEGAGVRLAISAGEARERLDGLEGILAALKTSSGHADRFLISLTADRPPLAAVSVGDLDSAEIATWAVPGMGASAAGLADWARTAQTVQEIQTQVDRDRSHAVVAWVGYRAPEVGSPDVLDTDLADTGAVNLDRALTGFTASRPEAQLNVVAHSYGTTTTAIALTRPGVHVDTFVSLGSAGLPSSIDESTDLHANHVFAGQAQDVWAIDPAPGDQWAWVGRDFGNHPVNPAGDAFGADVFGVDSGQGTAVTDHGTSTPTGTGYLDADTESLRNVALATTGQGDKVTAAVEHEPTPFQKALIEGLSSAY